MKHHTLTVSRYSFSGSLKHFLLCITLLCSINTTKASGQAATVAFVVDLQFNPLAPGEVVVVRGSSPTLGRWQGGDLQLSPTGGSLYSITIPFPERDLGQVHDYKFAILDDDAVRWESRGSRSLLLSTGHQALDPVFFNDMDRPVLTADLPVQFILNMNAFTGEPPTGIGIAGEQWPLGALAPTQLVPMRQEGGLWVADVEFEAGTPADISFTFFLEIDRRWQKEMGTRRHAVMLNNNHPFRTIKMTNIGMIIIPVSRSRELLADDYEAISSAIGAGGSRYLLDAALLQLEAGNVGRANELHAQFEASLSSRSDKELLQDVYPILYGQHLYVTGKQVQAEAYFNNKERSVKESKRKAAYAIALAEAQLAAGDIDEALSSFDHVENIYNDELDAVEAAVLGRGTALLTSGKYTAGIRILETFEATEMRRSAALHVLGHAYADSLNYIEAKEAFEALTYLGTNAEQIKARLLALDIDYRAGNLNDALKGIASLLSENNQSDSKESRLRRAAKNHYRTAHLLFLKAIILDEQGHNATSLFQEVVTRYADTRFAHYAKRRIRE